jgi:Tfp pilus assembly PilM family ATPase
LKLKFLEIETFSTIRSTVRYERDTTAVVDIGSAMTKFYIVKNGIVRKSHIINIGSANMLAIFKGEAKNNTPVAANNGLIAESVKLLREEIGTGQLNIPLDLTRIVSEIKKAIISYQHKNSEDINNIVFTGGVLFLILF